MASRSTEYRHRSAAAKAARQVVGGLPMPWSSKSKVTINERAEYRVRQERQHALDPTYANGWERPTADTAWKIYKLVKEFVPPLDKIHPKELTATQLLTVALDVAIVSARYGHRVEERRDLSDQEMFRRIRRPVTRNTLTDAIMRRWSDHARLARNEGRAYSVTQMIQATTENARRDLLAQNIDLDVLWKIIAHEHEERHPLFRSSLSRGWDEEGYTITLKHGRTLRAFERLVRDDPGYRHSRVRHTWRLWIVGQEMPLADHHAPICAERVFNEVDSTLGETSREVLTIQENTRLLFDASLFVEDYRRIREARKKIKLAAQAYLGMPWSAIRKLPRDFSPELRHFRERELKMRIFLQEFRSVYEQARREPEPVLVQSEFYKILNRRFQNAHFFPMQTSTKEDAALPDIINFNQQLDEYDKVGEVPDFWSMIDSARSRWFSAPGPSGPLRLISVDISSSQTQIQSVLLAIEEMEQQSTERPFKEWLAEQAWTYRKGAVLSDIASDTLPDLIVKSDENPDGYTGPDDKRLVELMKTLWMLDGYGPLLQSILRDIAKDAATYGPGWRRRPPSKREVITAEAAGRTAVGPLDIRGLQQMLSVIPGYHERRTFLNACKEAVIKLLTRDPYANITLPDPLDDDKTFTWNQPLMVADRLSLDHWEMTLVKPGTFRIQEKVGQYRNEKCPACSASGKLRGRRWICTDWQNCKHVWDATFHEALPNGAGQLQTDDEKMKLMVAPCIIHVLDALFSAHVMRLLAADGVATIVGVHDCWLVPDLIYRADGTAEPGHTVLARAIRDAGEPWLLALRPIYNWLRTNLKGTVGEKLIEDAYVEWQARVTRADWPSFFAKPSPTALRS
jgi:hypothetical protein